MIAIRPFNKEIRQRERLYLKSAIESPGCRLEYLRRRLINSNAHRIALLKNNNEFLYSYFSRNLDRLERIDLKSPRLVEGLSNHGGKSPCGFDGLNHYNFFTFNLLINTVSVQSLAFDIDIKARQIEIKPVLATRIMGIIYSSFI